MLLNLNPIAIILMVILWLLIIAKLNMNTKYVNNVPVNYVNVKLVNNVPVNYVNVKLVNNAPVNYVNVKLVNNVPVNCVNVKPGFTTKKRN
ncbi:hypothetical protein [Nostoc sp.]|uniref:hypothetical protein n=1 Tax=Nostoc sp. TaxID=1180 RepID=UPI002FFCFC8A